ncbi:MAG: 30S ribosomal protein S20 [Candidatus Saganbacteria bacterium]|nr:30S ribosomal protein S20 [Candidatus Saganbacteria bacterium]
MANLKSSIKSIENTKRDRARRLKVIWALRESLKDALKGISTKAADNESLVRNTIKLIDKAISNGILKKNTGARKKSRLMKKLNALKKS